jgi:hypothetical protein
MIRLMPEFENAPQMPEPSRAERLEASLKATQAKLESARKSLGEAAAAESSEAGDWMHTVMELEKEEEELVRALEDAH